MNFLLFGLIALLYSLVGHAGASGYIALMAFLNFPSAEIKQTSLFLNLVVSGVASIQFLLRGHYSMRLFLSFTITSAPAAYLTARMNISPAAYKSILGVFLCYSALWLIFLRTPKNNNPLRSYRSYYPPVIGLFIGAASGIIGVGGGIFLSPVLALLRWADMKTISGTSALFILVNSLFAFFAEIQKAGNIVKIPELSIVAAVLVGGLIGARLGSHHLSDNILRKILGMVLALAGIKQFI